MPWVPPLSVIEHWPPVNHVNPATRGPAIIIFNVLLGVAALVVMIARLYTRLYISYSLGADDFVMILAFIPTVAFSIISIYGSKVLGIERHIWDMPLENDVPALKLILSAEIIFTFATVMAKMSIGALMLRLTKQSHGHTRKVVIGLMIYGSIMCPLFIFLFIFQCNPVSDAWAITFGPTNCMDTTKLLLTGGCINTFFDFVTVLVPVPLFLGLQIPRRQQLIMITLFTAGFCVTVAGAVRNYYTYISTVSYDPSWDGYPTWLSASVELYVSIIAASVPPCKPLVMRYLPRLLSEPLSRKISNVTAYKSRHQYQRHDSDGTTVLESVELSRHDTSK